MKSKLKYLIFFLTLVLTSFFLLKNNAQKSQFNPENKSIELYSNQNGADFYELIEGSILEAKKKIFLSIFSLSDHRIIHALNKKALEGVDICIYYEKNNLFKKNINSNIKLHPVSVKGIMHRKILIIDENIVILGSCNFSKSSLHIHDNLMIKLLSYELAKAIIECQQTSIAPIKKFFFIGGQSVELRMLSEDIDGLKRIIEEIDKAQKNIRIAMFTWTHPKLTSAIIQAKERGVDVDIIIDKNSYEARELQKKFKSNGVKCRLSKKEALLHHKFAFVDDHLLIMGSANWTRSAFTINSDCYILLNELNEHQINYMNDLWYKIDHEASQL
jgi:cardiolipin synthase